MELVKLLLSGRNSRCGARRVDGRHVGSDGLDGMFELLHPVAFVGKQCNAQRANTLRQFVLQDRQGRLSSGRHQHALALGEVVADDVGNGVGFARARGALYDDTIIGVKLLNNGDLFVVVGHREEQLHCIRSCIAGRESSKRLLRLDANRRVPMLDEAANDAGQ